MSAKQFSSSIEQQLKRLLACALLLPLGLLLLANWLATGILLLFLLPGSILLYWQFQKMMAQIQATDAELSQQTKEHTQQLQASQEHHHLTLEQLRDEHQQALEKILANQLQDSNARLHHLTAQVPGAVFQLQQNADGKLSFPYASSAIQDLFQISPEQLQQDPQTLFDLLQAEDLQRLHDSLAQVEQALQLDLRVGLPQVGQVWRACHARAQMQADGTRVWHGIFMDITERQQQAEAIQAANARADAASQAKSAYLSNMTHEIRTPMNIILGMSYLALESDLSAGQRDYLENIRLSAEHLLSLINDILDMSKIEAGQLEVETIDFDLHETIANLNKLMAGKISDKGLAFKLDIAPDTPQALRGDPLRLSQVLINFIANAIKFTHQGSITLHIQCREQTEHSALLHFEVEDTGIGMNESECNRMFQAFQQADSSTSRKYGGTGLGLAISKQLVELMGGSVGLASHPGKGSQFWFSIKVQKNLHANAANREQSAAAAQEAAARDKASMQGRRILLVEDQPLNQRVAQAMLRNAGAEVALAENGQVALEILRQQSFDCILMDMQMPVMDGVAATRAIRDDPALANNLVIAMTANASMHNQALCMAAGMNDFITKPIKPAMLYAALAKWLADDVAENAAAQADGKPAHLASAFNLSTLSNLVGNDPSLLRKFALMFIDTLGQTMGEMEAAFQTNNWPLFITLAQSLHSEASSMDAMELAQLCNQLLQLSGQDDFPQAGKILAQMRPIAAEIDRQIANLPE